MATNATPAATAAVPSSGGSRWLQLVMGIVCMAMIANLQYGWTLFVDPIDAKNHWGRAAIQLAFTIFVVTETWLVPVEAWFVDKYGPRIVIMFGGVMIALAWILNSYADTLVLLYVAAIIGGVGAGAVYGTCVGNALKWFPDRRGLAAGATAAGFGAGAALTVVPIASMIASPIARAVAITVPAISAGRAVRTAIFQKVRQRLTPAASDPSSQLFRTAASPSQQIEIISGAIITVRITTAVPSP